MLNCPIHRNYIAVHFLKVRSGIFYGKHCVMQMQNSKNTPHSVNSSYTTAIQTIDMTIFTLIVSADLQYFLYFSQWKWLWWLLCVLYSDHDQVTLLAFNDNSALFAEFDVCESQHIPQRIFPALWTSPATHHWLREIMLFWAPAYLFQPSASLTRCNDVMVLSAVFLLAGLTFGRNIWFCQSLFSFALDTKLDIESAEAEDDLQNNEIIVPLRSPLSVTIYQTPVVSICKVWASQIEFP